MLGGVKHKKGRISNDVGLRKTQEGKDFQAKLTEVEWAKTQEGEEKKINPRNPRIRRNGVTAGRTNPDNHACFPDDARSARQQTPSNDLT